MLFSGKENVFMCLVAFQKNFRKIFSGVWKRRRKRQTQKNTDKTQKKNHQRSMLDWIRWRGASRALVRRPRRRSRLTAWSHEGEIAIFVRSQSTAWSREASIAISQSTAPIAIGAVLRKIAISDRSRRTGARGLSAIVGLDWSSVFFLLRARSLSLSLSFSGNTLKWKWKCKMISVVKAIFFGSTEINFRKILFSGPTKHPHFRKWFSPKTNTA